MGVAGESEGLIDAMDLRAMAAEGAIAKVATGIAGCTSVASAFLSQGLKIGPDAKVPFWPLRILLEAGYTNGRCQDRDEPRRTTRFGPRSCQTV